MIPDKVKILILGILFFTALCSLTFHVGVARDVVVIFTCGTVEELPNIPHPLVPR